MIRNDFFSGKNLSSFWQDLKGGAAPGLAGGAAAGIATSAYNAFKPITAEAPALGLPDAPGMQTIYRGNAATQTLLKQAQAPSVWESLKGGVTGTLQAGVAANDFLKGFNAPESTQQQIAQATQGSPRAQAGPTLAYGGGTGGGSGNYFSFEKYFGSPVENRPLIESNSNVTNAGPVAPNIAGQTEGTATLAQETVGTQLPPKPAQPQAEQYGRPKSGIKGWLYDFGNFLNTSKVAQGLGGFLGGLGGGALGTLAAPGLGTYAGNVAGGAAGGAAVRGIGGQLRNFFSEKLEQPAAQTATQTPSIMRTA